MVASSWHQTKMATAMRTSPKCPPPGGPHQNVHHPGDLTKMAVAQGTTPKWLPSRRHHQNGQPPSPPGTAILTESMPATSQSTGQSAGPETTHQGRTLLPPQMSRRQSTQPRRSLLLPRGCADALRRIPAPAAPPIACSCPSTSGNSRRLQLVS